MKLRNPNSGSSYEDYAYKVAVLVHERTGLPLQDAEAKVGDVSDMRNACYTVTQAADEILGAS